MAGRDIYTLDANRFDDLLADVLRGSRQIPAPANYDKGYWIELSDRCVVGVRWSLNNGLTLDVILDTSAGLSDRRPKFHKERKK